MVTLKDIARECDVSFSTVSKALKSSTEISAKTIERIRKVAQQMGYNPNIAARALRTNKTNDIGVIFEDKTGTGLQHQFFAKVFDGLNVETHSHGYDITFIDDNMDGQKDYFAHARYRKCDGIAIVATDFSRPDIRNLIASTIPTITLDYAYDSKHTAIMSDNEEGMTELTEYAIRCGHTKLAVIHGEDTEVTRKRMKAFFSVVHKYGLSIPDEYIIEGIYHDPTSSVEATEHLISLEVKPSCIFYPDDYTILGGLRVLHQHHIKPGEDISVAGYDGIMISSMLNPPLTTYQQNGQRLGRELAKHLIEQIENPGSCIPSVITVSGRLVEGKSIKNLH